MYYITAVFVDIFSNASTPCTDVWTFFIEYDIMIFTFIIKKISKKICMYIHRQLSKYILSNTKMYKVHNVEILMNVWIFDNHRGWMILILCTFFYSIILWSLRMYYILLRNFFKIHISMLILHTYTYSRRCNRSL